MHRMMHDYSTGSAPGRERKWLTTCAACRALTEHPSWAGHDIPVYWSDAERRQPPAGGGEVHGPFPRVSAFYTVTGSAPQRDFSFILGTARWQEEAK